MFYDVVTLNHNVILETLGTFTDLESAKLFAKLRKYDTGDTDDVISILAKDPVKFERENIPEKLLINVQTFSTDNTEYYSFANREWSLEKVIVPEKGAKVSDATITQDDPSLISSFTIQFPLDASLLLDDEISKDTVLSVAKILFEKIKIENPKDHKLVIENFEANL